MEQFSGLARDRYKFLVLVGRSRTGKTCYARQLCCPAHQTLELNCAAGAEPDLREYDCDKHGAILFDEASPAMVLLQKKLFQAQPAWVQLGSSTTNCHSYKVMLGRVPLIICSNSWLEQTEQLTEADREWITANQVLVTVDAPVWKAGHYVQERDSAQQAVEEEVCLPLSQDL